MLSDDEDQGNDFVQYGDYWEFRDPEEVEYWSLHMIAMTHDMCFVVKYKNNDAYLRLTYTEKVKDINPGTELVINIQCVTTENDLPESQQYNFTISFNSASILFNITHVLESLEPTQYSPMIKESEEKVDAGSFHRMDGTILFGKKLCSVI